MGVRRAQNGGVERAGLHAEVVDEAATTAQQGGVLNALNRLSGPCDGFWPQRRLLPGRSLCLASGRGSCAKRSASAIPLSLATYR